MMVACPVGGGALKKVAPAKENAHSPVAGGWRVSVRVSGVGWGSATMTRNSHSITPAVVPVASTGPLGEAVTVNAQPVGERGTYLRGRGGE